MTESKLWANHVSKLRSFGKIERLENVLANGWSDVVYGLRWQTEPTHFGWIELKHLSHWPARAQTLVRLPHFTVDQVVFLEGWGRAGVGAWLLAQIADEFVLINWRHARHVQRGLTAQGLLGATAVRGIGAFPVGKVLRELTKTQ